MNKSWLPVQSLRSAVRRLLLISLLLCLSNKCRAVELYLNAGESYVFNLNSFTFLGHYGGITDGTMLGFGGSYFTAKTEFFQNSVLDPSMYTDIRSNSG